MKRVMNDPSGSHKSVPLISVIMPVYNGDKYIAEAIDSILSQTWKNLELVICDDCSSDDSLAIARSYSANDQRVKLIRNIENKGIADTLNLLIAETSGEFIARMDADDACTPDRLEKQYHYMQTHNLDVCGSWIQNKHGFPAKVCYPISDDEIRFYMLFRPPFAHPSVMFRKTSITGVSYTHNPLIPEDYDLWSRLPAHLNLGNIPKILVYYRRHSAQSSGKKDAFRVERSNPVRSFYLQKLIPDASEVQSTIHLNLRRGKTFTRDELKEIQSWLTLLTRKFDNCKGCIHILRDEWFHAISGSSNEGPEIWKTYNKSGLLKYDKNAKTKVILLWICCTLHIPYTNISRLFS